mmetsp:Transcript_21033/g.63278  ORF Transcript_21033/g.63278 Transcript_21033/m.63278 type:complete len:306 (+) Transcript_21033:20-937(+)
MHSGRRSVRQAAARNHHTLPFSTGPAPAMQMLLRMRSTPQPSILRSCDRRSSLRAWLATRQAVQASRGLALVPRCGRGLPAGSAACRLRTSSRHSPCSSPSMRPSTWQRRMPAGCRRIWQRQGRKLISCGMLCAIHSSWRNVRRTSWQRLDSVPSSRPRTPQLPGSCRSSTRTICRPCSRSCSVSGRTCRRPPWSGTGWRSRRRQPPWSASSWGSRYRQPPWSDSAWRTSMPRRSSSGSRTPLPNRTSWGNSNSSWLSKNSSWLSSGEMTLPPPPGGGGVRMMRGGGTRTKRASQRWRMSCHTCA